MPDGQPVGPGGGVYLYLSKPLPVDAAAHDLGGSRRSRAELRGRAIPGNISPGDGPASWTMQAISGAARARVDDVHDVAVHRIPHTKWKARWWNHLSVAEAAVIGRRTRSRPGHSAFDHTEVRLSIQDALKHSKIDDPRRHQIGSIRQARHIFFTPELPHAPAPKSCAGLLR